MAHDPKLEEHPLPPSMMPPAAAEPDVDRVDAQEEHRLEQGLENTFPCSDPVAAKHIT